MREEPCEQTNTEYAELFSEILRLREENASIQMTLQTLAVEMFVRNADSVIIRMQNSVSAAEIPLNGGAASSASWKTRSLRCMVAQTMRCSVHVSGQRFGAVEPESAGCPELAQTGWKQEAPYNQCGHRLWREMKAPVEEARVI